MVSAAAWIDELKSGQALARLFAERGAQLVAIVLLLLLGLDAALILTRALGQGPALPSPSASLAHDGCPPCDQSRLCSLQ